MNYFNGTTAYGSTGIKTIAVGFQPVFARAVVFKNSSGSQTYLHLSQGSGNSTFQHVDTVFHDSTGAKTDGANGKIVSHLERVSGTITEVLAVSIDSFTATEIKLNVTTANAGYSIYLEVWG